MQSTTGIVCSTLGGTGKQGAADTRDASMVVCSTAPVAANVDGTAGSVLPTWLPCSDLTPAMGTAEDSEGRAPSRRPRNAATPGFERNLWPLGVR